MIEVDLNDHVYEGMLQWSFIHEKCPHSVYLGITELTELADSMGYAPDTITVTVLGQRYELAIKTTIFISHIDFE